jgi:heme-degrading monooxygenase HmoA
MQSPCQTLLVPSRWQASCNNAAARVSSGPSPHWKGTIRMHAHINIWQMNEAGQSSSDSIAREVAQRLRSQPGFHAYTLVRTSDREVVAITLFETAAQLHTAIEAVSDLAQSNIHQVASGTPETRAGDVIYHEMVGG